MNFGATLALAVGTLEFARNRLSCEAFPGFPNRSAVPAIMSITLVFYASLIALFSALGGSLPSIIKLTHQRIQLVLSFVSGVMLGVALLHLLPHSIVVLGNAERALAVCLFGLLFMFFMIRMFHFHQHDLVAEKQPGQPQQQLCDHEHDHHHVACEQHPGHVDWSWIGLSFGLAVHTLIDGIALASAVTSEPHATGWPVGLGVFLAVALHKPLDALSITSLMAAKGWNPQKQLVVNIVFALMCPLGALLFALTVDNLTETRDLVLGMALAFSAGIFLCISLGDLLPELHFHSHDRFKLSGMLILGVVVAWAIEALPGHNHQPRNTDQPTRIQQENSDRFPESSSRSGPTPTDPSNP